MLLSIGLHSVFRFKCFLNWNSTGCAYPHRKHLNTVFSVSCIFLGICTTTFGEYIYLSFFYIPFAVFVESRVLLGLGFKRIKSLEFEWFITATEFHTFFVKRPRCLKFKDKGRLQGSRQSPRRLSVVFHDITTVFKNKKCFGN